MAPRKATRPTPRPAPAGFPERLALYLHAMHREQAPALLDCLAEAPRARATARIEALQGIASAQRQALLTREFGAAPDAMERLQALLVAAAPPLRKAIVRHLPPALRAAFPHLEGPDPACPPAMDALGARLARETIRNLV